MNEIRNALVVSKAEGSGYGTAVSFTIADDHPSSTGEFGLTIVKHKAYYHLVEESLHVEIGPSTARALAAALVVVSHDVGVTDRTSTAAHHQPEVLR